ncbi:unnamed protein product [Mytilus coruscus]|uniref:Peptidase aspartic putative domain-containing protein n=1 Tax=Mytilus coruscus TaxID=42192 RepID=A0A6J8AV46_MYTCO|nr:unnamed protein product [Mytilus coruscus]
MSNWDLEIEAEASEGDKMDETVIAKPDESIELEDLMKNKAKAKSTFTKTRHSLLQIFEEDFPDREEIKKDSLKTSKDLLDIAVVNLKEAGRFEELKNGSLYHKLQRKMTESMLSSCVIVALDLITLVISVQEVEHATWVDAMRCTTDLHRDRIRDNQSFSEPKVRVKTESKTKQNYATEKKEDTAAATEGESKDRTMIGRDRKSNFVTLRTVPVILKNENRTVNALLYDASTKTYINADVAAELGLQGQVQKVTVNVLNDNVETFESIPFENLGQRPTVDMLIGLDYPDLHYSYRDIRGKPGEPFARQTPLGGTCIGDPNSGQNQTLFSRTYFARGQENRNDLDNIVRKFWEIENVKTPSENVFLNSDEQKASS